MSDGAEIFIVPRDQIALAWPDIERCISRIQDAPFSPQDVRGALEGAQAQAWGFRVGGVVRVVWITRIESTLTTKYGSVWICAGDGFEDGLDLYREHVEPWFWSQGCEWIEISGRKGWKRVFDDYAEQAVILRKYRCSHPS